MRLYLVLALTLRVGALTLALPDRSTPVKGSSSCRCGIRNGITDGITDGIRGGDDSRIVGGREAAEHEFPWQAALMFRGAGWAGCGATLISSRHVLTAAHCTRDRTAEQLDVLLRSSHVFHPDVNSLRVYVAEILDYPGFSSVHAGNDFSLLRLSAPVDFPADNSIAPACLPTHGRAFVDDDATVSGYGTVGWQAGMAESLRAVSVTVVSNAACEAAYPGEVLASMLCANGAGQRDACQGDSGGPLVSQQDGRFALIGVVSWGQKCAEPGYPGVYARVTEALDWILGHTAGDQFCE